jgi:hypothetical protein
VAKTKPSMGNRERSRLSSTGRSRNSGAGGRGRSQTAKNAGAAGRFGRQAPGRRAGRGVFENGIGFVWYGRVRHGVLGGGAGAGGAGSVSWSGRRHDNRFQYRTAAGSWKC